MTAVATLAELTVTGTDGTTHRLGRWWRDTRALLVFLRHYG
jgi:hypothetical protein